MENKESKLLLLTKAFFEKMASKSQNANLEFKKLNSKDQFDISIENILNSNISEEEKLALEEENRNQPLRLSKDLKAITLNKDMNFNLIKEQQKIFGYQKIYNSKNKLEEDYNMDFFNDLKSRVESGQASETDRNTYKICQEKFIIPVVSKEKAKENIDGTRIITSKGGIKAIGIIAPNASMFDFDFEDIFFISSTAISEVWGTANLTINNNTQSASQNLSQLLNHMEKQSISDLHFKLYNSNLYEYTATQHKDLIKVGSGFAQISQTNELINQILIDGNVDTELDGSTIDTLLVRQLDNGLTRNFRVSIMEKTFNHTRGYSASIRRLPREEELKSLKDLGYHNQAIYWIEQAIKNEDGLIVISGETNSGKSTFQASLIVFMRDMLGRRIHRIESPAETSIKGVVTKDLLDRATAKNPPTLISTIKDFMRQDPDVICVGEARTDEELEGAFNLARTGHLTMFTAHAKDNRSAIARIRDAKNIREDEFQDKVRMAINQSLIPKTCHHCRKLQENGKLTPANPKCPNCGGKGIAGIIPIYELTVYGKLDQEDDIFNLEKLLEEKKAFHISKTELYDFYVSKGWVDPDDDSILAIEAITKKLKNTDLKFNENYKETPNENNSSSI